MFHGWHHLGHADEQAIEDAVLNARAPEGPYHLELQPTNHCNARCTFCCTTHFRHGEQMRWPQLERVLVEEGARNLRFVRLIGGGEPLLYPQFDAILRTIRDAGPRGCDLTTNGIMLERFAEGLADARCENVHVSLNEPTRDLYAATMRTPPGSFDRVLAGALAVSRVRDAGALGIRLVVQFFVNAANWREVGRMYDLGMDLGADIIDVRTAFQPASGADLNALSQQDEPAFLELLAPLIESDLRLEKPRLRLALLGHASLNHTAYTLQAKGLPPGDERVVDFRPHTPRREYCYMPWYSAVIAASGRVFSCCQHTEMPDKLLGEIGDQGFQPIWHGARFTEYRRQMREVMLTRGEMVHSPRCHGCLSENCTENFGCNITFMLASDRFYDRMVQRMEEEFGAFERAGARARNSAVRVIRLGRRLAQRVRGR